MSIVSDFLNKQLLVLKFGSKHVVASLFSKKGKSISLIYHALLDNLEDGFNNDPQVLIEKLSATLERKISKTPCVVILPADFGYTEVLTIPRVSFFNQETVTCSYMRQFLGIESGLTMFSEYPLFRKLTCIRTLVCFQKKKIVEDFCNKLLDLNFDIVSLQTPLVCFLNFLRIDTITESPKEAAIYINITSDAIHGLLFMKKDLYAASSSLKKVKKQTIEIIADGILRLCHLLQKKAPSLISKRCYICVHSHIDNGLLINLLREKLTFSVELMDVPIALQYHLGSESLPNFVESIGAAYQYFKLSNSCVSLDVSPKQLLAASIFKRNKNKLAVATCGFLTVVASLALYFKKEAMYYEGTTRCLEEEVAIYKDVLEKISLNELRTKEQQNLLNQLQELKSPTIYWIKLLSQLDQLFYEFDKIWINTLQPLENRFAGTVIGKFQNSFAVEAGYGPESEKDLSIPASVKIQGSLLVEGGKEEEAMSRLKGLMDALGKMETIRGMRDFSMRFRKEKIFDFEITLDTLYVAAY